MGLYWQLNLTGLLSFFVPDPFSFFPPCLLIKLTFLDFRCNRILSLNEFDEPPSTSTSESIMGCPAWTGVVVFYASEHCCQCDWLVPPDLNMHHLCPLHRIIPANVNNNCNNNTHHHHHHHHHTTTPQRPSHTTCVSQLFENFLAIMVA